MKRRSFLSFLGLAPFAAVAGTKILKQYNGPKPPVLEKNLDKFSPTGYLYNSGVMVSGEFPICFITGSYFVSGEIGKIC